MAQTITGTNRIRASVIRFGRLKESPGGSASAGRHIIAR
jgi:hypothetical protein